MNLDFSKKFDDVYVAEERLPDIKRFRGLYPKLEVVSITSDETKDGTAYMKIALKVIESTGAEALAPGTDCVRMLYADSNYDYDLKEYKQFCSALLNIPATRLSRETADGLADESNPAAGKFIRFEVVPDPKNEKYNKNRWITFGATSA